MPIPSIELSRIDRDADRYMRWFRYYDHLLVAGIPEAEAATIVETAQADERIGNRGVEKCERS